MCTHCDIDLIAGPSDAVIDPGRRRLLLGGLATGGLAAFGPMRPLAAEPGLDEVVRIGYLPITDATALLVAHANGYFEEQGLKVERPTLIRGWSPLVESFAAGKFNLVHLLNPIPVWMRYNNHFPVKITAWAHVNGSAMVVGRHVEAKGFGDLGRRQIAVPYWYSIHNILAQAGLRHAGLKPVIRPQSEPLAADEVNLQVLAPSDMPPALAARKIDGYIVAEPFDAAGELLVGAKVLRFTGDIWENHPCCVICMNERQIQLDPQWVQKAINALVQAEIYAQRHKEEVAVMLSRDGKGYLPMPADVVVRAMTHYGVEYYPNAIHHPAWDIGRIDFHPYPFPSATQRLVEYMSQTLVAGDTAFLERLEPGFVASDLVDYRFIQAAMRRYPGSDGGAQDGNPFVRGEVIAI